MFLYLLVGCPIPAIELHFNGQPLSDELKSRMTVTQDSVGDSFIAGTITLDGLTENDGGEYQCVIRNSVGNATSNPVKLEVLSGVAKRSAEEVDTAPCPSDSPDTGLFVCLLVCLFVWGLPWGVVYYIH